MASSNRQRTAQDNAPKVDAPEPSEQVPEPLPAPTERVAPHISAGVAADIALNGSAVDPFTGKTLTADDLA